MSAQPKANEPSMEEILASIRRIIADDEKPAAPPEEAAPEPAALAPQPQPEPVEDDVLDLGAEAERIEEPAPEPAAEPADDIDFAEPQAAAPVEPAPEPVQPEAFVPPPPAPPQPAPVDMTALISDQTGAAVQSAFGALANTVLSNNARTLEDLVKDMLKPMLKTWLDDNLPSMVERLVRAEIERVARGGRR
ncbi:DUF2497 domain-containing protein [Bosea sp. CS1GBMeth4]|uniref:PopZ family protein n=1 Tax=Bosea sp. CS1GBMeth4 TaxID=1892849 RepID=UPI001FCEA76E|nr:DUF2497 domain-containing protein [Bosea sp. CS1GBMeth4]